MQKKVSFFFRLLIVFAPLYCFLSTAETEPKILVPKSTSQNPINPLKPKPNPVSKKEKSITPGIFKSISFSILLGTALIHENFYEKRFAALGNFHLFSIPLAQLNERLFLHIETGPGFSYSKLTFQNPPQSYNHLFLLFPARVRLIYSLTQNLYLEGIGGLMLRPIEYDSRQTSDGGTHSVKGINFISPDVGLGLDYNISPSMKVRVLAGYLFLVGGVELTL